jgi:hypothetical protein
MSQTMISTNLDESTVQQLDAFCAKEHLRKAAVLNVQNELLRRLDPKATASVVRFPIFADAATGSPISLYSLLPNQLGMDSMFLCAYRPFFQQAASAHARLKDVDDKLEGRIDPEFWTRKQAEYRGQARALEAPLSGLSMPVSGENIMTVERVFELANKAHYLYLMRNSAERGQLLKSVLELQNGRRKSMARLQEAV